MEKDSLVLAILRCPKIGNNIALRIILENSFDADKITKYMKERFANFEIYLDEANREILKNMAVGISLITIFDQKFPRKLYSISNPILYLYYKGNISLLNRETLLIIGTREPTQIGINNVKKASGLYTKKGYCIASGLALGIDTIAHLECINNSGDTIAILPSALNNITPVSNNKLANLIEKKGLLITEYSVGSKINKFQYAQRDRVQSAIADTTLVIEAKETSGTMISANISLKEGKKVFQIKNNNLPNIESIDLDNDNDILKIDESISIINKKPGITSQSNLFD